MASVEELAEGFVLEYLERQPEYIDVAEYVADNDDEEPNDDSIAAVYQNVANILSKISTEYLEQFE